MGVLVVFLVAFVIGTVLFLTFLGPKRGARFSAGLLLAEYMGLILLVAVFCRKLLDVREFHVIPFRSYWYIWEGGRFLVQVFMNVLVFVPIGLLLGCTFGRLRWKTVLSIGGGFSLLIEVLQFVFRRGFAEFDDVFHNVLGCAIGFGVYVAVAWLVTRNRPVPELVEGPDRMRNGRSLSLSKGRMGRWTVPELVEGPDGST